MLCDPLATSRPLTPVATSRRNCYICPHDLDTEAGVVEKANEHP